MSSQFSDIYNNSRDRVVLAYTTAVDAFEKQRAACVKAIGTIVPGYSNVVDRISRAVPEVLCALSALTGVLTLPACLLSVVRNVRPLFPLLKSVARFDFTSEAFKKAAREIGTNMKIMFDRVLVPALLVYFAAQSVLALSGGLLALNYAKLLYASAIALPATWLAYDRLSQMPSIPQS